MIYIQTSLQYSHQQAPQKAEQWNSTLDAFDFGNDCIQPNPTNDKVFFGFEDCLNLNVFVPNKCSMMNSKTKMPVVFYILGGQFSMGTASFYGPEFLLETNVIIVGSRNPCSKEKYHFKEFYN